jgi:N-acetylmuramoyl-L-alanine amidase
MQNPRVTVIAFTVLVLVGAWFLTRPKAVKAAAPVPSITNKPKSILIAIDAGHGIGAKNVGATNPNDGAIERDENLKNAKELEKQLKALGMKTVMLRTTAFTAGEGYDRAVKAEKAGATVLVSLHMDCWENKGSPCTGTMVIHNNRANANGLAQALSNALNLATGKRYILEYRPFKDPTNKLKTLGISAFERAMCLIEVDRTQRLSSADRTKRMTAIAQALARFYGGAA